MKTLYVGSRSACLEIGEGLYSLDEPRALTLNGEPAGTAQTCVFSLWGLMPATDYCLETDRGETVCFRTEAETVTFDVRRFGAAGDGEHDDTAALQAAILACPAGGRVLIPAGLWRTGPLFLKSHLRLEIARGATLRLIDDRSRFPILPGLTQTSDETEEIPLGTWEGNPLDTFASLLTGVEVEDVAVCGEGVLDGGANPENWWKNHRTKRGAWRPRMIFLCRCRNVTVQGLTVRNSPAWNLHPFFSEDLRFLNLSVEAPADSPNTDGFDPESCRGILLAGTRFSLGDDCIAVKSGKIWMGMHYKTPCEDIDISHCLMENGHGGVTVGSEMAGGVRNMRVRDCLMRRTDRGLRIKTRRGRGEQGVIDGITFERVRMENVLAPLVVNALYFCDPDGHSPWVQSREKKPVDSSTPRIGTITFRDVTADGAACAGYILGLPERPVERVALERVRIRLAEDAEPIRPAMADGVPTLSRTGLVAINTAALTLEDTVIEGASGEPVQWERGD
ncbi:MAG: glycoside hydrolase family 28 protein [Clostridia bacterium]|nr:glycoside hydrolase family 28 protein [Clostridia bacterium]